MIFAKVTDTFTFLSNERGWVTKVKKDITQPKPHPISLVHFRDS